MSFSVQLATDVVLVDPGATIPVAVTVVSRSTDQDRFELDIEGIDPEWKAIPVPIFTVEPNETHEERFFLKPPRSSESASGDYPLVVRVRSLNSGEAKVVQAILRVKPFHHISIEILPKKGFVSPFRKQNTFTARVINLGNTEHSLQFIANDPEDACTFDFENEQTAVGPGQTREVEFEANPVRQSVFMSSRLIGFTLTGRSVDSPNVVASAQAQLEQRPFFSLGTLISFVVIGILYGLWLYAMPKPPKLDMSVDARQVLVGKSIEVKWSAQNASKVLVYAMHNGQRDYIYEGRDLTQTLPFTPKEAGEYSIRAEASKDDGRKTEESLSVIVREPDKGPAPDITSLSASPTKIKLGQSFLIKYKFNENVKRAVLGPMQQELNLQIDTLSITPTQSGDITYTVAAYNESGVSVTKSVTVSVVDTSDATILGFDVSPKEATADNPKVLVTWQVTNAARIELKVGDASPTIVDANNSQEIEVKAKTELILRAVDAKGRETTRRIVVPVAKPPTGPDPNDLTTGGTKPPQGGPPAIGGGLH